MSNSDEIIGLRDVSTPIGAQLSGIYKKSFAYVTLKDRLPVILTGVIDTMSRDKEKISQKYSQESLEELKRVIGDLSKLRNELMTNKPLTPLALMSDDASNDDTTVWNDCLNMKREIEGSDLTWYKAAWLLSECYMYRRINQALTLTKTLKAYDPFEAQKQNSFAKSLNSIKFMARHTTSLLKRTSDVSTAERKHEFVKLMKLDLWGNRCDLSLSAGAESNSAGNPLELLDSLDDCLLIDDARNVWDLLNRSTKSADGTKIIDIVLDNAGYELFGDLCLASFVIAHNVAERVRFYVKRIPWYVSDANLHDFNWTIDRMIESEDADLREFGDKCVRYLNNNQWIVEVESFWTEPYDFGQMKEKAPGLYRKLAESVLVIFKGDLNYRKLMGDVNWEYTTSLEKVLNVTGFRPTNLVTLRTIKADLCVGLTKSKVDELLEKDNDWMITGKYGVVHATFENSCVCNNNQ